MGILSGIGKAGLGLGKAVGKGIGFSADVAGKKIVDYGSSIIKNTMSSPIKAAATIGAASAAGYMMGDIEHGANPVATAGTAALGAAALSGIPGATTVGAGIGMGIVGGASAVGGFALGLGNIALKTPDAPVSFSNMSDIKFSKIGKGMITGTALYEGIGRAANKFVQGRMGTNDGMMRTATPIIPQVQNTPSYANNGGATGDLVFSMYNNR